jgi:TrmH family RNA methyltransferase
MTGLQITSRDNPLLKMIRLIASGSKRTPEGLVLAEGIRVLEEAVRAKCSMEAAIVSDSFGSAPRERALLEALHSRRVRLYKVSEKLFKTASGVQNPQGAMALVQMTQLKLEDIKPARLPLILYCSGIQDPGNIGTLIRTAAAAGATMVCTEKGTVSARNPKSIRASAGAFFHLPPVENVNIDEFLQFCRSRAIQPYRTDVHEGLNYLEADLKAPCAILLGNEGSGMSKKLSGVPSIQIPMSKQIESLNVAVAGAILLFESARQRRVQPIV